MFNEIRGKLIVSCQALEDEPLHSSFIMGRMARAAKEGGAVAIRAQGVEDIVEIKEATRLPVIGIIKKCYDDSEIYITPTKEEVDKLLTTKCEMIALDATNRTRPNGESLKDLIDYIKENGVLVMADISTYEEGINAYKCGVDIIGTTMNGYTNQSIEANISNLELVSRLAKEVPIPIIAEGKIHYPYQVKEMLDAGAFAVVVGGAITRPLEIAKRFVDAAKGELA